MKTHPDLYLYKLLNKQLKKDPKLQNYFIKSIQNLFKGDRMPPKGWKKKDNVINERLKKNGKSKLKSTPRTSLGLDLDYESPQEKKLKELKLKTLVSIANALQQLYSDISKLI